MGHRLKDLPISEESHAGTIFRLSLLDPRGQSQTLVSSSTHHNIAAITHQVLGLQIIELMTELSLLLDGPKQILEPTIT